MRYPPRYGPEWGSGGVFGLRYYRGVLYYMLAFEAEAHFVKRDMHRVYRFELVGRTPGPRSGGDTYNAIDVVDEYIYFGGWVHAPPIFKGRIGYGGEILFNNKYSHVHEYNIHEDEVKLLWSETLSHESEWAGEVSEIIYDPINDKLLIARADGHRNLGVYAIERRSGKISQLSVEPALKGSLYLGSYACFDGRFKGAPWTEGVQMIQCLDLIENRWIKRVLNYKEMSIDRGSTVNPYPGTSISSYGRLWHFIRGGVIIGNPIDIESEPLRFYRLFDFGYGGYGPLRTTAVPLGGGILVAFNAYTHGLAFPRNHKERLQARIINYISGPTVLVYITPPMARIVATLGARVTSMDFVKDKVILGMSDNANLGAYDAAPVDSGNRIIIEVPVYELLLKTLPVQFSVKGTLIRDFIWGGIPLYGYKKKELEIIASKDNKISIYEYDIQLPTQSAESSEDVFIIKRGSNRISLEGFRRIVSFKLHEIDEYLRVRIHLQ